MRFEDLPYDRRIATLKTLYRRFNREFYNNQLSDVSLDICNLGRKDLTGNYFRDEVFPEGRIEVDYGYITEASTQLLQVRRLSVVLLHEMVHHYCYLNGITDEANGLHLPAFYEIARTHGLFYDEDAEGLNVAAWIITSHYRMR